MPDHIEALEKALADYEEAAAAERDAAYDGRDNSLEGMARSIADSRLMELEREHLPALIAEVKRLRAERERDKELIAAAARRLTDAAHDIESWGVYAGEYLAEKNDLAGDAQVCRDMADRLTQALGDSK